MTARWRADDYEPIRPQPDSELGPLFQTPGEAARDAVLAGFVMGKPTVVNALRNEAVKLYRELQRPVSANDVRPVLARLGYTGDPRILVSAFPLSRWEMVGWTKTDGPNNHARLIRTYQPKGE